MRVYGLSPLTILLHPIRTLKWIVTFIPVMNKLKRIDWDAFCGAHREDLLGEEEEQ